jgi:hypothetical protein
MHMPPSTARAQLGICLIGCNDARSTDRHHNNVLFTPDGELALIDLSASLGKEAPMDKALRINPIYIPERLKNIREQYAIVDPCILSLCFRMYGTVRHAGPCGALSARYTLHMHTSQCTSVCCLTAA